MVTDGYKETEVGVIPVEWEVVKIKDFSSIATGNTPPTKDIENYGKIYPWITPTDIGNKKNIFIGERSLSEIGYTKARQLPKNTVLITSIASIGKNAILRKQGTCNQQINAILPSEKHSSDYIYYWFENNTNKIIGLAGQTAILMINKTDFSNITIPLPPLKEQEKIADILSTADEKIDAIASQIQKAQTLKKGLLQKLLSEGIGHSEFKDSELGKIAKSWEVSKLENLTTKIGDGLHGTPQYVEQSDYYFINGNNLNGKSIEITENTKCVSEEEYTKNKKILDDSTILLSINGTIGSLAYYSNETVMLGKSVAYMNSNNKIVKQFLFYLLKSSKILNSFMLELTGTTIKNLSLKTIRNTKIPLPPLKEQKQIAEILSTADEKLEVLMNKKEKYETLKKGLLQKLLSGEVRV